MDRAWRMGLAVFLLQGGCSGAERLYHVSGAPDAINLELSDDDTFRWGIDGCDTFGGSRGLVVRETDDTLTLVPEKDASEFMWLHGQVTQVRLEVSGSDLLEGSSGGRASIVWVPGGVCASCGPVGPKDLRACSDPKFFD